MKKSMCGSHFRDDSLTQINREDILRNRLFFPNQEMLCWCFVMWRARTLSARWISSVNRDGLCSVSSGADGTAS
jgi:hypothetical protein